jgi:sirohydrochlorin cobaltochelatase
MPISADVRKALEDLDASLRIVLPAEYRDAYEAMQPVAMGSAGLKYGDNGKVAWDEIWDSFCDLAMAGGPPHKGMLLEPALPAEIEAQPGRYQEVVDEICRGVTMVTDLPAVASPIPGWVRVDCHSEPMAGWLLRAIVMENVAVRARGGRDLDLPAGPGFRIEKEIKNVITVIAKTCHYWMGHMPRAQQRAIASLFTTLAVAAPLVEPAVLADDSRGANDALMVAMAERIQRDTGLPSSQYRYAGWLGVQCPDVRAAVWMMRALVVSNVLSRREGVVLFVPVNPETDPHGDRVCKELARIHGLAQAREVL